MKICILGPNGRMGRELIANLTTHQEITKIVAYVRTMEQILATEKLIQSTIELTKNSLNEKLLDFFVTDNLEQAIINSDLLIDFTVANSTVDFIKLAIMHAKPMVIGTTGLQSSDYGLIDQAAKTIPILQENNMSLGIHVMANILKQHSNTLINNFDIEICDIHHRNKIDAPSGTALFLGNSINHNNSIKIKKIFDSTKNRNAMDKEIRFSSMRCGGIFGDHNVVCASNEEVLTLQHRALNRNVFAKGAVQAAKWIINKEPNRYFMSDVLFSMMNTTQQ